MPPVTLRIFNEAPRFRAPRALLHKAVETACSKASKGVSADLVFVTDREMIRLHTRFLRRRSTTDVLTFVLGRDAAGLGIEVYVCVDTARRQAREHRISLRNEIVRLAVHGMLHAMGYDDHAPRRRARMWKVQEAIVQAVGA